MILVEQLWCACTVLLPAQQAVSSSAWACSAGRVQARSLLLGKLAGSGCIGMYICVLSFAFSC
jgi:hypothetical protein